MMIVAAEGGSILASEPARTNELYTKFGRFREKADRLGTIGFEWRILLGK